MTGTKRKSDTPDSDVGTKRAKLVPGKTKTVKPGQVDGAIAPPVVQEQPDEEMGKDRKGKGRVVESLQSDDHREASTAPKQRIVKLAPPRPFPTVPTAVSATGPRSAHAEGKNLICVTRKTKLGAYLKRCKDVILKDGYKTLQLSALGAAIPLAVQLSLSLPTILPHDPEEIHTEVRTGTVEVQDELIPQDEEQDISFRTRGKSSVMIIIRIGDGVGEVRRPGKNRAKRATLATPRPIAKRAQEKKKGEQRKEDNIVPERIVVRADDMDED